MADRLKIDIKISREPYGSQEYTVVVTVTNIGDKILSSIEIRPQLIPGRLISEQETKSETELDILEAERRRLFREMEEQVAAAYEKQSWRKLNPFARLGLAYVNWPELIASRLTGEKVRVFRLPSWATEATRISGIDDVERLERDFISHEKDDSLLRKIFIADKEKAILLMSKIEENGSEEQGEDDAIRLLAGDSLSFTYRCRAPHLYRQKTYDCQFRITYRESEANKTASLTAGEPISIYASPFAVPVGAVLGAGAGFIVKSAFLIKADWFTGPFWTQFSGSLLLALIVAFGTARSPDKKKLLTVEDFVGGFVIGAVSSLFSEHVISWLQGFVPKAGA